MTELVYTDKILTTKKLKRYFNNAVCTNDSTIFATSHFDYIIMEKLEYIKTINKNPSLKSVCFIEVTENDLIKAYFKNNHKKIPQNILNNYKLINLRIDSDVMTNMTIDIKDKYTFIISKAYLDFIKDDDGRKKGDRWIEISSLISFAKNHCKYDISGFLPQFLKSSFVSIDKSDKKTARFQLKTKEEIYNKRSFIYATVILERNERFSFKKFIKTAVEFLYAMPRPVARTSGVDYLSEIASATPAKRKRLMEKYATELVGYTNQSYISKLCGISQARVSQICRDFLKVYTFQEISEKEFNDNNFESMNENGHKNHTLRKYQLEKGIDLESGEIKYKTVYYALKGTRLISHLHFASSIYAPTKKQIITRSGEEIEIVKSVRKDMTVLANTLRYATKYQKLKTTNKVHLNPKTDSRPYAKSNEVTKCADNTRQVVARSNRIAFDKLTSTTLKNLYLDLVQTSKIENIRRERGIAKSRKQIGYSTFLINKQLQEETLDAKRRLQLQVISNAYNKIKSLVKSVDERIMNQRTPNWNVSIDDELSNLDSFLDDNVLLNVVVDNYNYEVAPF